MAPGDRGAVGAAYVGTAYGGVATGHRVLGALALTGMPIYDVEAGCASEAAALALGAAAIRSGEHRRVLVVGVEKMPKGMIRSRRSSSRGRRRPGSTRRRRGSPCGPSGCCGSGA